MFYAKKGPVEHHSEKKPTSGMQVMLQFDINKMYKFNTHNTNIFPVTEYYFILIILTF